MKKKTPRRQASHKTVALRKKEQRFQSFDQNNFLVNGIPQPDPFVNFEDTFGVHAWVYAATFAIASNLAGLCFDPYILNADGEKVPNDAHLFKKLMERPNPYITGYDLKEFTFMVLELTGNCYWAVERLGTGTIKELWPLPTGAVRAVSSPTRMIDHYVLQVGGKPVIYAYDEIIHFKYTNPKSFIYGQGSVAAVKNDIAADLFADSWNRWFFRNAGRPDAILETDEELSDDVRRRTIESWKQLHGGMVNRGKTGILEGGMKYKEVNRSPKDMDYAVLRNNSRDRILAAFGVPPAVVGVLEYANYSNMEQQVKMFWKHTLVPKIRKFEANLTMRARQVTFDLKDTFFLANLSMVEGLREDEKEKAQTVALYVDAGIPINQVIERMELPFDPVPGGDLPRPRYAPSVTGPAPTEPANPVETDNPDDGKAKRAEREKAAKAAEELRKEILWKSFDAQARSHEDQLKGTARAFFKGQQRRVISGIEKHKDKFTHRIGKMVELMKTEMDDPDFRALKAAEDAGIRDTVDLIFNIDVENKLMARMVGPKISGTFYDFAVRMTKRVKPGFDFNLQDPKAIRWLESKRLNLSRDVNGQTLETITQETIDAVKDAVDQGFSAGDAISGIVDRIDEVYRFALDTRAERIARTEVMSAANAGSFDAMKQTGVRKKKWLSARDNRVRDTHEKLDDDEVGVDEDFISESGAKLSFPGDPRCADLGEIINCRCAVDAVVED